MRLIDADLLVKDMYEDGSFPLTLADKVTEKINSQRVVYANGWIPAHEPPGDNKYILISFENFSVPVVGRYEEDENGGAFYAGDEDESLVSQNMIVNAWQPLPEKYIPEEMQICTNKECPYNEGDKKGMECTAWNGCGGFEKYNDISHQLKIFTEAEQALIDGVELARDWQLPIPPEDYAKYLELTENRDVGEK